MSSPASALAICAACGEETSLVCAACLKTRFCSRPCAAKAWAGHRAACAEFAVLEALPDEALSPVLPAAPLASMESAGAGASEYSPTGTGFDCAVCGKEDAAVCARCRLVGYCGAEHQRKDWPTHKLVCRKGETRVVPVLTWEQRMLAEAHAAAPASLAAFAALPPIPEWNTDLYGAPPTKIMRAWRKAAEGGHAYAQYKLGFCYSNGKGVAKDVEAAAEWYAKAAAQGNAAAQNNLGVLYKKRHGCCAKLQGRGCVVRQGSSAGQRRGPEQPWRHLQ
jgi:TPR repeat protein